MPGGRHGLQNRRPGTPCRGVGSIPTLSAILVIRISLRFSRSCKNRFLSAFRNVFLACLEVIARDGGAPALGDISVGHPRDIFLAVPTRRGVGYAVANVGRIALLPCRPAPAASTRSPLTNFKVSCSPSPAHPLRGFLLSRRTFAWGDDSPTIWDLTWAILEL